MITECKSYSVSPVVLSTKVTFSDEKTDCPQVLRVATFIFAKPKKFGFQSTVAVIPIPEISPAEVGLISHM